MKLYDGNAKGKRSFGDFIEIDTETKRVQFPVYVNKKQKSNNITRKEILKILIHFYIVFFIYIFQDPLFIIIFFSDLVLPHFRPGLQFITTNPARTVIITLTAAFRKRRSKRVPCVPRGPLTAPSEGTRRRHHPDQEEM